MLDRKDEMTADERRVVEYAWIYAAILVFCCVLVLISVFTDIKVKEQLKPETGTYTQVCEMCGSVWEVTPTSDEHVIEPTVEWCFYDGNYCETGLELLLSGDRQNLYSREFLNHCLHCSGCRCAAFSPEKWSEFIDALNQIRDEELAATVED